MAKHLPPPPANPALSPPVTVTGEEAVTLPGLPGEPSLEGRVAASAGMRRAVVLCHPHPLYGGTMHSAVVVALAKTLAEHGMGWIRMNYRGVGASLGRYGDGKGETSDVRAAIQELRRRAPEAALTVCGYSFGTWVGLRAAAMEGAGGGVERVALIAPAVRVFAFVREDGAAFQGRLAIYVGDRDEFCDVSEAKALASELGASLQVFPGSDHFFLSSRRKLATAVLPFIAPEAGAG